MLSNPDVHTYQTCCHWCESRSNATWQCQWFGKEGSQLSLQQIPIISSHRFVITAVTSATVITLALKQNQIFAPTVKNAFANSTDVCWLPHLVFIYLSRNCGSQNNNIDITTGWNYGTNFFWSWQMLEGGFCYFWRAAICLLLCLKGLEKICVTLVKLALVIS